MQQIKYKNTIPCAQEHDIDHPYVFLWVMGMNGPVESIWGLSTERRMRCYDVYDCIIVYVLSMLGVIWYVPGAEFFLRNVIAYDFVFCNRLVARERRGIYWMEEKSIGLFST